MKPITKLIIEEYNLKKIDFMGYEFTRTNATYHHLIVPRRNGGKETFENGAVLNGKTSHPYLHIVESIDQDKFNAITNEMIIEKMIGGIDQECLKKIDDILTGFERENSGKRTSKGRILIKEEYTKRTIRHI